MDQRRVFSSGLAMVQVSAADEGTERWSCYPRHIEQTLRGQLLLSSSLSSLVTYTYTREHIKTTLFVLTVMLI